MFPALLPLLPLLSFLPLFEPPPLATTPAPPPPSPNSHPVALRAMTVLLI
jgi:hypothetical protein